MPGPVRDVAIAPGHWWWLSFVDDTRRPERQFLGTVILSAPTLHLAIKMSHAIGVNPGGRIQCYTVNPVDDPDRFANTPKYQLLTRDELVLLGWTWAETGTRRFNQDAGPALHPWSGKLR